MARQATIDHAFNQFIRDDGNSIDAADAKKVFRASLHPLAIRGDATEDEVFLDFLTNFQDRNNDGRLHREDWNAHYLSISANVPEDDHFC
jgi:hypothetical protein